MIRKIGTVLIFGAICFTFIFVGYSSLNPTGAGFAVRVDDTYVSFQQYRNQLENEQERYRKILGDAFLNDPESQKRLRESVLNGLIQAEIQIQGASQSGIRVSDEAIREEIMGQEFFQENGAFQRTRYQQLLQANRLSPTQYEGQVRRGLIAERLDTLLETALKPTTLELEREQKALSTTVDLEFVQFNAFNLNLSAQVTDEDINKFLADEASAKEIKSEYDKTAKDRFTRGESVKAKHILISFKDRSEDEAKKIVTTTEDRLKAGEAFEVLAKELSEDPGSKENGGDLGQFSKGQMVPEFEKVAFSLKPGETSGPVKTSYGYHIIKVEEKLAAKTSSFDEVKNQMAREKIEGQKLKLEVEKLTAAVKAKDQAAIDGLIKTAGLKWDTTGKFNLAATSVPKLFQFQDILGSIEGAQVGSLLPQVFESNGSFAVAKLKSSEVSKDQKMSKDVETQLSRTRLMDSKNRWIQERMKNAKIETNSAVLAN
jgi:peptidyl-prolyl cis-trans isomerase D